MKRALLLIGMLLAFEVHAQATYHYGNELNQWCRDFEQRSNPVTGNACVIYVSAVADVMAFDSVDGFRACIPVKSVTNFQVASATAKFLREHPEKLYASANTVVAAALAQAFPCKK